MICRIPYMVPDWVLATTLVDSSLVLGSIVLHDDVRIHLTTPSFKQLIPYPNVSVSLVSFPSTILIVK